MISSRQLKFSWTPRTPPQSSRRWLEKAFRTLHVKQPDAAGSLERLRARRDRLEKIHEVKFADDALECAVQRADIYLKEKSLPGKALELLDAAGAAAKLRASAEPSEIADVRKKLAFIADRMESAIANHEFEKAKFYSDEERKEKENLRLLRETRHLAESSSIVGPDHIQEVISRWSAYPYCP